jgi:transposase InsO family protein
MRRKNLARLVKDCYFENRRRCGTRRIKASLNKRGIAIGRYRVRSLMREQGLEAIVAKKYKPRTTDSKGTAASPNLLKEIKLEECAVGKIIIGDITYIPLQNGRRVLFGSLARQGNTTNHRLEFGGNDAGVVSHFSFNQSDQQRFGQRRSDHSQ